MPPNNAKGMGATIRGYCQGGQSPQKSLDFSKYCMEGFCWLKYIMILQKIQGILYNVMGVHWAKPFGASGFGYISTIIYLTEGNIQKCVP